MKNFFYIYVIYALFEKPFAKYFLFQKEAVVMYFLQK